MIPNNVTNLCRTASYTSGIEKTKKHQHKFEYKNKRKERVLKMMINAILLTVGLVVIPAMICAHTEMTCNAAA